jgi:predicted peptidase
MATEIGRWSGVLARAALPLASLLLSCASAPKAPTAPDSGVAPGAFTIEPVFGSWLFSATPNGRSFGFYLYLPDDYQSSTTAYPLLLYMQGWGNFGKQPNPALLSSGPLAPLYLSDSALDSDGRDRLDSHVRNSIVVTPRLPYYDHTYQDTLGFYDPDTIQTVVDYILANYRVDQKRLYVTGLSEGGGGTWGYAWRHSEKVAAIVPVSCGLAPYPVVDGLKKMPIWMLQDFDDPVVPHALGSDAAFSAITGVSNFMQTYPNDGGDYTISYSADAGVGPWTPGTVPPTGLVTYTLYASGGHDAWTRTYANPDIWLWLYAQSK